MREEDQDLHLACRPPGVRPTSHDLVHVGELVDVENDSGMESVQSKIIRLEIRNPLIYLLCYVMF